MSRLQLPLLLVTVFLLMLLPVHAQKRKSKKTAVTPAPQTQSLLTDEAFEGLELRSIGPAFMSGRIADIAFDPSNPNTWYIAVASGGVWKTVNAGTTWKPVFDEQSSFSIGCVSVDPQNPNRVWVGTGENVGGRHMGFGDGVYRSEDGGETWKNMGLPNSEHISKILIHPQNSDVIWVAAQGPLWSSGGDRGLYVSTDGGQNWTKTLGDEEWTGVTDIVLDPRDPDRIYAATWQRHRTVAAYMGGGPGTALYRSEDGGQTWEKLSKGLPESNMGKIGLAISPQQPDILYAAIELDRRKGGVYRSANRGASWTKMSDAVAGATGPHYYQELYASPHHFERLYLMDNNMQMSTDGGKTFHRVNRVDRHGDNHALAFKADDPDYLMVGTDGGLYESFDDSRTWRYIENLPLTQFYKVAVDDAEPFYNIYGGTQDNSTEGGPSRTDNIHGIMNSDWKVVLNWDGHQPATEPGNPDIIYAERQQGTLSRVDMTTGETTDIQPQPGPDEDRERYNWDAPILVSPHKATRIYFASQRVWRSENRGDSWTAISGDLTRHEERLALPIMGSTQSWDNPWDLLAMSNYNTITSLAESPQQEGLLYAGTDDGMIQVTEDGGQSWRKIEAGSLPGVPATAFVNDIKADLYDANTVYVALDNHKYGDYMPYLLKSSDRGASWQSLRGNLPDRTLVWRLVQDHVVAELMFLATEWGIYFTVNGGRHWTKLQGGVPTISFRDLAIQRRENDLVGASFGRSFYVLDDYSALREVSEEQMAAEATLFSTRKAWWYMPRSVLGFDPGRGSQGSSHFLAPNPPFGAVFTYHLAEGYQTAKAQRQAAEKKASEDDEALSFPGWDAVETEAREAEPKIWLTVRDAQGNVIRRIEGSAKKGFHRVAWDLRFPNPRAISLEEKKGEQSPTERGLMAAPGSYTVILSKEVDGVITPLSEPRPFEVERLREAALEGASPEEVAAFWRELEAAYAKSSALGKRMEASFKLTDALQRALSLSRLEPGAIDEQLETIRKELLTLRAGLQGMESRSEPGEKARHPTVNERLFAVSRGVGNSTYGPTPTHRQSLEIVMTQLYAAAEKLEELRAQLTEIGEKIEAGGGPKVISN